jgi:hypothetical protein
VRGHRPQVVVHLDIEYGAAGVKRLDQVLNGQLVDLTLLLAELFVQLVLKVEVEREVLDRSILRGFLEVGLDSQFSLEIELRDALEFLL